MLQRRLSEIGARLDGLVEEARAKWMRAQTYAEEANAYRKLELTLDAWYLAHFLEEGAARRLTKSLGKSTFSLWAMPVEILVISIRMYSPEGKVDIGPYRDEKEMAQAIHDWAELALKHRDLLKAKFLYQQGGGKMRPTPEKWVVNPED